MVYPYAVKHNGRYYAAGMEVPENGISASALDTTDELEEQEVENVTTVKRRGRKPKTEE